MWEGRAAASAYTGQPACSERFPQGKLLRALLLLCSTEMVVDMGSGPRESSKLGVNWMWCVVAPTCDSSILGSRGRKSASLSPVWAIWQLRETLFQT